MASEIHNLGGYIKPYYMTSLWALISRRDATFKGCFLDLTLFNSQGSITKTNDSYEWGNAFRKIS